MNKLTATGFFRLLYREKNIQPSVWMKAYNDFVVKLFAGNAPATNKVEYHNMLVYTSVELAGFTDVSKKKCSKIPAKSH
jgi:hypothetical protein